ncbi:hypothetical protein ACSHWO_35260 (plasmid) [Streptomyces sp. HUAS TT3]|uniref:hypothetical protein n=1 Tax=Streptomyces sp. HUAS TT3 TaxID=3447510 RepID=UPI003F65A199
MAVKLLQPHVGTDKYEKLLFREARTAGALSHPGIVTVHDLHDLKLIAVDDVQQLQQALVA